MIILGIDPALTITGYGAINFDKGNSSVIEAGIIQTCAKDNLECRLDKLYKGISKLIIDTKPGCLVLEKLYAHHQHPTTAFLLGHARGVICLACAENNVPLYEYAATRVKKAIVGKGLASKAQVQRMIISLLKLKQAPKYLDVTDALALAIAHSYIAGARI